MGLIDLSHPLTNHTPPFPGDPPVVVSVLDSTDQTGPEERTSLNCGQVSLPIHCATHMDAPFHFYADRPTIEQIPLDWCSGPALRLDIFDQRVIDTAQFEAHRAGLIGYSRLIIHTGWYRRWGQAGYFTEHPVITGAAAQLLVDSGIRLVGVDFPSVDRPPHEAHRILLGGDLLIVENLTNLASLTSSTFEFTAFPLSVVGRDGSPVRAVGRI